MVGADGDTHQATSACARREGTVDDIGQEGREGIGGRFVDVVASSDRVGDLVGGRADSDELGELTGARQASRPVGEGLVRSARVGGRGPASELGQREAAVRIGAENRGFVHVSSLHADQQVGAGEVDLGRAHGAAAVGGEVDPAAGERGLRRCGGRRPALVQPRRTHVGGNAAIGEELSEQALGHRRAALVRRAQEQDPRGVDGASVVARSFAPSLDRAVKSRVDCSS